MSLNVAVRNPYNCMILFFIFEPKCMIFLTHEPKHIVSLVPTRPNVLDGFQMYLFCLIHHNHA